MRYAKSRVLGIIFQIYFLLGRKMDLLELFLEHSKPKQTFLPRKLSLDLNQNNHLYGPKFSGKRSLIYHHIQTLKDVNALFIDFEDLRFNISHLRHIDNFIKTNNISHVVLYGFDQEQPPNLTVPTTLVTHDFKKFEDYRLYELRNLDFEEYLLFDKRNSDIKVAFNMFLKNGNAPEIVKIEEYKKELRYQEMYRLTFGEDIDLFKEIAYYQGHNVSAYFLYTRIKERLKISKDRFYEFFEKLQQDGYLYALNKMDAKRAPKRLFFHNFLTKPVFHPQREFPKLFENMVFCEIAKKETYYLEPLGLYIPKEESLILPIPFGNEVRIQEKIEQILKKNKISIKKIEVITVASRFFYEIQNIPCEILPFYEWAVAKEHD